MKAGTFAIWVCLLALTIPPITAYGEDALLSQSLSLTQALDQIRTPDAIIRFMKQEFKFVEDRQLFESVDYWQRPEELWQRKAGDCEDYALFAQHALRRLKIEAYVVSFYGRDGYAHTVTVFRDQGLYNVINGDRLYRYRTESVESALTRIYPTWTWGAVAEEKDSRGSMIMEIRNPRVPLSARGTEEGIGL